MDELREEGRQERRQRLACINCGHRYLKGECRYWYGADDVGPFCEACDRLIKVHTRFKESDS